MDEPIPRWREYYHAALLELDPEKLLRCIDLAEAAIREYVSTRRQALQTPSKAQEIQDALYTLRLLRRSALPDGGPDTSKK